MLSDVQHPAFPFFNTEFFKPKRRSEKAIWSMPRFPLDPKKGMPTLGAKVTFSADAPVSREFRFVCPRGTKFLRVVLLISIATLSMIDGRRAEPNHVVLGGW